MSQLTLLVKNQLRVLFRSRATVITLLVAPLLLLVLAGFIFDSTSVNRLRVGVWNSASSDLSDSVLVPLQSELKLTDYPTEEKCQDAVRLGDQHACFAFGPGFALGTMNTLKVYVDPSRTTLLYSILETLEPKLASRTDDISRNLVQSLVGALETIKNSAETRRDTIISVTTHVNAALQGVTQSKDFVKGSATSLELNGTQLSSEANAWMSQLSAAANLTANLADDIRQDAISLDAAVNATTLSNTTKQSLRSDIANVTAAAITLKSEANESVISISNLTADMLTLQTRLQTVKSSIDTFNVARDSTITTLTMAKSRLDSALLSIADLQKFFNEISTALSGVTITDAETLVSPVKTVIVPVTSEGTYVSFALPLLMVIVLLFTGVLLPSILIVTERHSQAAFRSLLVPLPDTVRIGATFLSSFVVLGAQAVLLAFAGALFFKVWLGLPLLLLSLLVLGALFILIGMIVGYIAQKEVTAVLSSIILATAILFSSGMVIPIDVLPGWLAKLSALNPVLLGAELVRHAALFTDIAISRALLSIGELAVAAIIVALVLVAVYRHQKQLTWAALLTRFAKK